MSEGIDESTMEERLRVMMEMLPDDDLRYLAMRGAIDFRSAWVELAETLHEIAEEEAFKEWGYRTIFSYCQTELAITRATTTKLLDGYRWLKEEAPEYLPKNQRQPDGSRPRAPRPTPELNAASAMAQGYKEMEDDRIAAETYAQLKAQALQDGARAHSLTREFKEAVPEHLREETPPNPLRHLKRALSELEKALEQLEEDDQEMIQEAARLRDAIYNLVSQKQQLQS